jgi:two-component system heavy metal sensor histidine kinase CusS
MLLAALAIGIAGSLAFAYRCLKERDRARSESSAAKAKLERSERSRSQIIVELAHDLRTPLTSILTIFESLQGSRDAEYIRQGINVALPDVEYLNHLIDDLFLLSQMQEPAYRPKQEAVCVTALVRDEVTKARALSSVKGGTRFELREGAGSLDVISDPFLLRRLVKNLLSNAGKFARSEVKVSVEDLGGQGFRLSVTDDGPGFVAEEDPLGERRPDLTGKSAASSSIGLGSVIVRRITQLHGGYLRTFNRTTSDGRVKGAIVEVTLSAKPAGKAA